MILQISVTSRKWLYKKSKNFQHSLLQGRGFFNPLNSKLTALQALFKIQPPRCTDCDVSRAGYVIIVVGCKMSEDRYTV